MQVSVAASPNSKHIKPLSVLLASGEQLLNEPHRS